MFQNRLDEAVPAGERQGMMQTKQDGSLVVVALIAFAFALSSLSPLAHVLDSESPSLEPSIGVSEGILLVSGGAPEDLGLYAPVLEALPRAGSQKELERLAGPATRAIVIDRSIAGELSSHFLAQKLASGVQIFGLNMTGHELKSRVDWGAAYEMANGRPAYPHMLENWDNTARTAAFFTYIRIRPGGFGEGTGRLDIQAGLFQVRLAAAAGLSCRELAPWSACDQ